MSPRTCQSIANKYSMAKPSLSSSVTKMDDRFLEGVSSAYELYIADSKMSGAGSGLFVREEVPPGKEVFRAALPAVSAVLVFSLI